MAFTYEKQHVDFVLSLCRKGLSWPQIAAQFSQKFNRVVTSAILNNAMHRRPEFVAAKSVHDKTRVGIGSITKNRENVKSETLFITACTPMYDGTPTTHAGFMKSIETFLANNGNSKLYVLPMRGHNKPMQAQDLVYDAEILKYRSRFVTDMEINGKLKIFDARLNPQAISPLTGLHHIQDGSPGYLFRNEDKSGDIGYYIKNKRPSLIVAHTKQLMETIPTGKSTLPRIFHTTGTCSMPDYRLDERIGKISQSMHTLGGLIIDIIGDYFFFRQVQANLKTGEFVDLGYRYHPNGRVTEERPLIMKPGDKHNGETDPYALKATYEQADYLKPLEVIWEDYFSGNAVNPHIWNDPDEFDSMPDYFRTLQGEREVNQKAIADDIANFPSDTKHIINACNHHRFLNRWLKARQYDKEPQNRRLGKELACAVDRGLDPVQVLIDSNKEDILDAAVNGFKSKMEWLKGDESYVVEGVENGEHGHNGIKGGKGSKQSHYLAYGKANIGHVHSPGIYNGIYMTGALTEYKQSYNKSQPICTLHTNLFQYAGGHRQLVTEIGGVWARGV